MRPRSDEKPREHRGVRRGRESARTPRGTASAAGPTSELAPDRVWPLQSRFSRWRALSLGVVHLLIAAHIAHALLAPHTLAPLELNEIVYALEAGIVTAGFLFMILAVAATAVFGRFFCSWGCHFLALQDLCAVALHRLGVRPKAIRSRLLAWAPACVALYMFVWPVALRWLSGRTGPQWRVTTDAEGWASFWTEHFWRNLPGPGIATLTFLVCGAVLIYVFGSRGFCTYVCPYGAVFAWADRAAPGRIRLADRSCRDCGRCTAVCGSHVRVADELQRYGMVVDPACLKDLDCVGVCPDGAVHYGFGPPALAKVTIRDQPVRARYDFSWTEEALLAAGVIVGVVIFRGLYEKVSFFLSLALGLLGGYQAVLAVRLVGRPTVFFNRGPLKREGRWFPAGIIFAGLTFVCAGFTVHSAAIRYLVWTGLRDLDALNRTPVLSDADAEETRARLDEVLRRLEAADRWGFHRPPNQTDALARAHAALGASLIAAGRVRPAIPHLRRAIDLRPDFAAAHAELGAALSGLNDVADGLRHLRIAVRLDPQSAKAQYNLGVVLAATGRPVEARQALTEARRLDPNDAQTRECLRLLGEAPADAPPVTDRP